MSQQFCLVDKMEVLSSSEYDATPAAMGGEFPALRAVPKITKNLVAYPTGLIVVTPYLEDPPIHALTRRCRPL